MKAQTKEYRNSRYFLLMVTPLLAVFLLACDDAVFDDENGRVVATINVQEGIYLGQQSAKVGANFKRVVEPVCGVEVETFGQCTIATRTKLTCAPECSAGQVCTWTADCSAGECIDSSEIHAGEITIMGATHQDPLTCSYNATLESPGYECDVNTQQDVFEAGDSLRIVSEGDAFPAFDITVASPPDHSFTTDIASWTASTLDGTDDVLLEWDTDETADELKVTFITNSGDMVCNFPDTGSFVVPREGLAALGDEVIQVDIHRQNRHVVNEGDDGEITVMTVSGRAWPIQGGCYSCAAFNQACQVECPDESEICEGAAADALAVLNDCLCGECSAECELTCTGSGVDSDCQACRSAAMQSCSAERATCMSN